jgi:hypothetical protein
MLMIMIKWEGEGCVLWRTHVCLFVVYAFASRTGLGGYIKSSTNALGKAVVRIFLWVLESGDLVPVSCESKVANANIILVVNKDIFRFEVPMDDRRRMNVH